MESPPNEASPQQEAIEGRRKDAANDESQSPPRELSYSDLLRLLSCLEGELQARDVLIALLKAERAKQLLAQARYGRLIWREPFNAFQRDAIFENTDDNQTADHDLTVIYESQLNQLEKLINSQRKANERAKELLSMVERKHLKTLRELEVERRRRKHDAAQGDDVYMMLEKEREKLQKEIKGVQEELQDAKAAVERSRTSLEREKDRHKEIVLYLLQERRQLLVRFAEERARNLKCKASDGEEDPKASNSAQLEMLRKQLEECNQNLEEERAMRVKLEQTVKTQEEDLTLIRQTIINKVKQSSSRQKLQAVEPPPENTVKANPKLANAFHGNQKKGIQPNDRKQQSSLARSAPGIGSSGYTDDFSRYHILSRAKMLCDSQEAVGSSTPRIGATPNASASPKLLRHQMATAPCPYTSGLSFACSAGIASAQPKGSSAANDHYSVIYGPGGQILPSQIPQHSSRRVPQLPSTEYMNSVVKQPAAIRQANEAMSYNSPPSYNLALQYSNVAKEQWTAAAGSADLMSANPSNIPLHTSVGRRPAAPPAGHLRRPAGTSGAQQVCSGAKVAVERPVDEREGIVEPEIAQLEAVINSLIMASSFNADLSLQCPSPLIGCATCDEEINASPSSNGPSGVTDERRSAQFSQTEANQYTPTSVQLPLSSGTKVNDELPTGRTVASASRCNAVKVTKASPTLANTQIDGRKGTCARYSSLKDEEHRTAFGAYWAKANFAVGTCVFAPVLCVNGEKE
uniref:CortBP2 domain-containing protein n=1 Tax=Trichuris muris TaxID=70415 RepID=A0A5S6QW64_TRIMR